MEACFSVRMSISSHCHTATSPPYPQARVIMCLNTIQGINIVMGSVSPVASLLVLQSFPLTLTNSQYGVLQVPLCYCKPPHEENPSLPFHSLACFSKPQSLRPHFLYKTSFSTVLVFQNFSSCSNLSFVAWLRYSWLPRSTWPAIFVNSQRY